MAARQRTRITLSTVAADAGVAMSTASIILSRNATYLPNFSPATVLRVRESAKKLNYRPNLFASSLPAGNSSMFFVVAMRDPEHPTEKRKVWGLDGDFLAGIAATGVESRVFPIVMLLKNEPSPADMAAVDRVVHGGVLGAIALGPDRTMERFLRASMEQGQPVVAVFPSNLSQWPSNAIDIDNESLGRRAGRLFAAHRRKRWLMVFDEAAESHQARLRGFTQAARSAKAHLETLPCPESTNAGNASLRVVPWLAKFKPDAVFALTSKTAEGILHACGKLGLRVGIDILLVGCDCALWQTPLMPAITSLEASWRDIGSLAMQQLLATHDSKKVSFASILVEAELVPGDTCPVLE